MISKQRKTMYAGVILVILIVIIGLLFAWPTIYRYENTRFSPPATLKPADRKQYLDRWNDILKNKQNWGQNEWALFNEIGELRSAVGDYKGAADAFVIARARAPLNPTPIRNFAVMETYLGNYAAAEGAYLDAFRLVSLNPEYWLDLGRLYYDQLHDKAKARAFYIQALSASSNNLDVIREYANFLGDVDLNYSEAAKYWQILVDKDPQNRIIYLKKIEELKALELPSK